MYLTLSLVRGYLGETSPTTHETHPTISFKRPSGETACYTSKEIHIDGFEKRDTRLYKAIQTKPSAETGLPCFMKSFQTKRSSSGTKRHKQEIRNQSFLAPITPAVVPILDSKTEKNTDTYVTWIVYPYFKKGDLVDVLAKTKHWDTPHIQRAFRPIVESLVTAHNAGIAHRDIKLENILMDDTGALRLSDFGYSKKLTEEGSRPHSPAGTEKYMAPQISCSYEKRPVYDPKKADVWSLGCALFFIHIGSMFNVATNTEDKLHADIERRCASRSIFADLLKKMLKADESERITMEDVLSHPFFTPEEEKL